MSKRSYQLGPMDPSSDAFEEGPCKRKALNLLEAIRHDPGRDNGDLQRKGNGFLYEFNQDTVFYSPNCNRADVRVPPKLPSSSSFDDDTARVATSSSGVLLGRDFDVNEFMQPQWWTASQGYFAFTPRILDTSTPTFRPLRRDPIVQHSHRHRNFHVDRSMLSPWKTLQDDIITAVRHLREVVALSTVLPLPPCAQIEGRTFQSTYDARYRIDRARGWFNIWAGILGYSIAVFSAVSQKAEKLQLNRTIPAWMDVLLNQENPANNLDAVFVSDVSRVVAQYDGSIARVGAFIELPETPNEYMVSIDWLLSVNVPVWWAWGPREERIASTHPVFYRYRPPANALRVFGGSAPQCIDHPMDPVPPHFDISVPSPTSAHQGPPHNKFEHRPSPTAAQLVIWTLSQQRRQADRTKRLAAETDQQRQTRIAVEQQPPTRFNKVQYWVWSLDLEADTYTANLADKDEAQLMFSSEGDYSRQQAEFDYFGRQWHVADFLGVPNDAQLARMAEEAADFHATPYDLELLRLRVWYGLDDIPAETPAQMKERLVAADDSSNRNAESGEVVEVAGDSNAESGEAVKVAGDPNAESGEVVEMADDGLPPEPSDLEEGELVDDSPEASANSSEQLDVSLFNAHHARTESTAYLLCGYLAPNPYPNSNEECSRAGAALVTRLIGQIKSLTVDAPYWSTNSGKSLARFGADIMESSPSCTSPSSLWDLSPSSRNPVMERPRFQLLRRLEAGSETTVATWDNVKGVVTSTHTVQTRVIWIEDRSDQGWYLGTTSPAVALHMCRLEDGMSPSDVAYDLLSRGFRIQTWVRLPATWRTPTGFTRPSPSDLHLARYRRSGHTWTHRDYDSWQASVKIFMRSSRGRAAVLRGGIVWRIVVPLLLPECVLFGPSHRAMRGEGFIIKDHEGRTFIDDDLTNEEVDLLCGVHYVYIDIF